MRFILWIFVLFIAIRLDFAIYRALHASNENYSFKNFRNEISNIPKQFPYTVKIFSRENQNTLSGFSCSGSIVGSMWILTAGHCVYGFNVIDVFIGNVTNDMNHVVRVSKTFLHPNYTFEPELMNDIALLRLRKSLNTLNNTFDVVSLPSKSDVGRSFAGLWGIVAGYGKLGDSGKTSSSVNWARYEILSMKECKNFFTVNNYTEYIERNFCGRGIAASTCQGDSGQALVIQKKGKKKLIGIISNGYESCETVGEPELLTRVDRHLDFINDTMMTSE